MFVEFGGYDNPNKFLADYEYMAQQKDWDDEDKIAYLFDHLLPNSPAEALYNMLQLSMYGPPDEWEDWVKYFKEAFPVKKFDGFRNPKVFLGYFNQMAKIVCWFDEKSKIDNFPLFLVAKSPAEKWYLDQFFANNLPKNWESFAKSFEESFPVKKQPGPKVIGRVSLFDQLLLPSLPTEKVILCIGDTQWHLEALLWPHSNINLINDSNLAKNDFFRKYKCSFLVQDDKKIRVHKRLEAIINRGNERIRTVFYAVPNLAYDLVLGNSTSYKLRKDLYKSLWQNLNITSDVMMRTYLPLFQEQEPIMKVPFQLLPGHKIVQEPARWLPREKLRWAKRKIAQLIRRKIVRRSNSPYASPCVVKPKKGFGFRLVQDYTELNKVTKVNDFPIPNVDRLLHSFSGCKYFTKLDLTEASYQIGLTEETKKFTAFVLPFGKFEMNRLPVGWKNTSAIIQQTITKICGEIPTSQSQKVRWYTDDIIIGGATALDCFEMTKLVLEKSLEFGITMNQSKCRFFERSVEALGKVIDGDYIHLKDDFIEKVTSAEIPSDSQTLMKFLGLTGSCKMFIDDYESVAWPLKKCNRKNHFKWSRDCQAAFDKLVKIISSCPKLRLINFARKFHLKIQVSLHTSRTRLFQIRGSTQDVVGYYSYSFRLGEVNYCPEDKERLAVVKALKYFDWIWSEDTTLIIHTDYEALTSLMNMERQVERQAKWKSIIMKYNPTFEQSKIEGDPASMQSPPIVERIRLAPLIN